MTNNQLKHLMPRPSKKYPQGGWWWQACQAQGWNYDDRNFRLTVFSEAVGRRINSATELNTTNDVDRLKAFLLTKAANVKAAMEQPHDGDARRTMHLVRGLLAELEDLHPEPGAYVMSIIEDITKHRYGVHGVEDLGTAPRFDGREKISELEQFHLTLNKRIHGAKGLKNFPVLAHATEPEPELEGVPF